MIGLSNKPSSISPRVKTRLKRAAMATAVIGLATSVVSLQHPSNVRAVSTDVTASVQNLGKAFNYSSAYPRNVWDLQVFGGKLYIGNGNSNNEGPGLRPGPVAIKSLDLATNAITTEYTTNEDQVAKFKVLNGKLVVPGTDPRDSHDKGNYYTKESTGWVKTRTIQNGVHNFDMASFGGKLFTAIGTADTNYKTSNLLVSSNNGSTWTSAATGPYTLQMYEMFSFAGSLYSTSVIYPPSPYFTQKQAVKYDGSKFVNLTNVNTTTLFPGKDPNILTARLDRVTESNGRLFYTGFASDNNDTNHGKIPFGLFTSTTFGTGERVNLPDAPNALTRDILARTGATYVLASTKQADGTYVNSVFKATGTTTLTWSEVFSFTNSSYARSIEENNGDFYFGLGTDADELTANAGTILKVPAGSYVQ